MKKTFLIILLTVLTKTIFCQTSLTANLNRGKKAFEKGDYALADSLFTLCVDKSIDGTIYYNRAYARLNLKDTCGFCSDIRIASEVWRDDESKVIYQSKCGKTSDTTYYTSNFKAAAKPKFRYFAVTAKLPCDSMAYYSVHDKQKRMRISVINLNNMESVMTASPGYSDVIARAYIKDSVKVFYHIDGLLMNDRIDDQYSSFGIRVANYISQKYQYLKPDPKKFMNVPLIIRIDKTGKVAQVRLEKNPYFNGADEKYKTLQKDLYQAFNSLPAIKPASLYNAPVDFELRYTFELR
jgi:hypothetical protein